MEGGQGEKQFVSRLRAQQLGSKGPQGGKTSLLVLAGLIRHIVTQRNQNGHLD
jgi:hypothetical protein